MSSLPKNFKYKKMQTKNNYPAFSYKQHNPPRNENYFISSAAYTLRIEKFNLKKWSQNNNTQAPRTLKKGNKKGLVASVLSKLHTASFDKQSKKEIFNKLLSAPEAFNKDFFRDLFNILINTQSDKHSEKTILFLLALYEANEESYSDYIEGSVNENKIPWAKDKAKTPLETNSNCKNIKHFEKKVVLQANVDNLRFFLSNLLDHSHRVQTIALPYMNRFIRTNKSIRSQETVNLRFIKAICYFYTVVLKSFNAISKENKVNEAATNKDIRINKEPLYDYSTYFIAQFLCCCHLVVIFFYLIYQLY